MSSNFWSRGASTDAWFRIGRLEVTTTVFVVLLGAVGVVGSVIVPVLPGALAYYPALVLSGEVWRIVTWPLADSLDLWSVLNLFFLWYFGREIEATLGRIRMARLLLGIGASLTIAVTLVALLTPGAGVAGLSLVEFMILVLWIAEYPTRRFLFNIPAWAFGAVLVALQILSLVGAGAYGALLALLLSFAFVALVARRQGLLTGYRWIPGTTSAEPGSRPRQPSRAERRDSRRRASDDERMDDLLGKISAEGIHALSRSERAELEKLRQRRRR
ncbi:MAG: rhomboid family intramembrane serine protease [Propioniciclava sp.]